MCTQIGRSETGVIVVANQKQLTINLDGRCNKSGTNSYFQIGWNDNGRPRSLDITQTQRVRFLHVRLFQ